MAEDVRDSFTVEFDGGSRGNPGPAAIGVVVRAPDGTPIYTLGRFLGRQTNNVAEYHALLVGLEQARALGARHVVIRGDSELVIRQMTGEYRVRHPALRDLHDQAQVLVHQFESARFEHHRRRHNALADKLANLAMDRQADVTDIAADSDVGAAPPATRWSCPHCGCRIDVVAPPAADPGARFICCCGTLMEA
jgi:ribonuclease HI